MASSPNKKRKRNQGKAGKKGRNIGHNPSNSHVDDFMDNPKNSLSSHTMTDAREKPRIAFFFDLIIILIFTFLNYVFVLIPPFNESFFRIPFSLPLLLFIPGYMLIAAMFPKKDELSAIERFTLSIGLAVAIYVFDGFAISVTPWRFRPNSIVVSLSAITLILMFFTIISRKITPPERRYLIYFPIIDRTWSRRRKFFFVFEVFVIVAAIAVMILYKLEIAAGIWMVVLALMLLKNPINSFISILRSDEKPSDIEKALMYALIGSIIIASGMLIYAKLTFQEERFTALYILGKGGKAENYPEKLYILESNPIIVGIENYEHAPVNYTLKVFLGKYLLLEKRISLKHEEKWQEKINLVPRYLGKHMKLSFQLFKEDSRAVYREVHLWVDSVIDYNNISIVRAYSLKELPTVANSDMNYAGGWSFERNLNLFRGYYSINAPRENSTFCGYVRDDYGKSVDAQISINNHYGYTKSFRAENGYFEVLTIPDHFWVSVSARGYQKNEFEVDVPSPCLNITLITAVNETIKEIVETPEFSKKLDEILREELNQTLAQINQSVNQTTNQTLNVTQVDVSQLSLLEKLRLINASIEKFSPDEYPHLISVLKGYVIDKISGQPVENATIRVTNEYGFVQKTKSDENGYYEVKIISGDATVEVFAYGYAVSRYTVRIASVHEVNLEVIPRSCVLKGFVVDDKDHPVSSAYISIRAESFSASTTTNETGYFEVRTVPGNNSISVSKYGYESVSLDFALNPNEVKEFVVKVKKVVVRVPVLTKVRGTLTFNGMPVNGVVVAEKVRRIEENASIEFVSLKKPVRKVVEAEGSFDFNLEPGFYKIYAEPEIYSTPIILRVEEGKKIKVDLKLNALPDSYRMIYPSETMPKGAFAGIYQEFNSSEGLGVISFKVHDSYKAERETKIFKQVLLNGVVVWEDDVGGNEGWEEHLIPVTFENGKNRLELRIYAKGESRGIISVDWDDVRILPLEELIKYNTTRFDVRGIENGDKLILGKPKNVSVLISNREFERLEYKLEIRIDGFPVYEESFSLDHNQSVEKSLSFIPNIVSSLNRLDFNLYARGKLYQQRSFWVSTEADFTKQQYLENVKVEVPELLGFESWSYSYTGNFSVSMKDEGKLCEMKTTGLLNKGNSSSIWLKFNITPPANVVVAFKVKDNYDRVDLGLKKQLLVNGEVLWEDDVGDAEGWQYVKVPVTLTSGENFVMLRLYSEKTVDESVSVLWSDVKLLPITELMRERVTTFLVLNAQKEERYPERLYLGKPETFWVRVENHEYENVTYLLEVKFNDEILDRHEFELKHGQRLERNVSVLAEDVADLNLLEFDLYKIDPQKGNLSVGSLRLWLPSVIDLEDEEVLQRLALHEIPAVTNGDFEDRGGWLQEENGNFIFMRYETDRGCVYSIFPFISISENESAYIVQKVGFKGKGVVILNFSVSDSYTGEEETGIVKRVVLNGKVVWEDDLAGNEGWQTIRIPVYIDSIPVELKLGMFAYESSELVAKVFFDKVQFEMVS